jgi:NitT/TauT family transport system substrate-binding protein
MKHSFQNIILLCLLLVSFTGCRNNITNEISIGIPDGPSVISMMRLIDHPPVIDGRKVRIIVQPEPQQIQSMMVRNQLDFAMLPTVMAANLYNKGVDYRLLAIPVWGTLYVVTNDRSIHDTSDLNNMSIHIFGQGTTADVLFRHFMLSKQLENINIDYSYSTNQEIAMALLNRRIKTAIVSEPLVSMLISKDNGIRIISELTLETGQHHLQNDMFAQTAFLVNSTFAEKNPEIVEKLLSHVEASSMSTRLQREKTAYLLFEHNFMDDVNTALRSIPLCNINFVRADGIREVINSYLNIFYTFDPASIGGKLPDERFIGYEE